MILKNKFTSRNIRGKLLAAAAAAAALLCGFAAAPASAKMLVYCSESSPEGFDPALYSANSTWDASSETIYDRLTTFKVGTTETEPGLAESWTISSDNLEYTFNLRKGVKFHTTSFFTPSRDFNADDVLFTFNRQIDKDNPWHRYATGANWEMFEAMVECTPFRRTGRLV